MAFDAVGGDVTVQTFRCMGFNGRHLIAGFSEDIQLEDGNYITPRAMAYGNFSLCGVCLVYVNDPLGTRRTLGFNWPSRAEGQEAHARILELLAHRRDPHRRSADGSRSTTSPKRSNRWNDARRWADWSSSSEPTGSRLVGPSHGPRSKKKSKMSVEASISVVPGPKAA